MSKIKYLTILFLLSSMCLHAQNRRLSLDVYGGFPAPLTFFSPSLSTYGGLAVKYNLIKEFSIGARFDIGTLSGKNGSVNSVAAFPADNNNYSSSTNNFYQYTLEGQIDLERVFGMRKFLHRINPYVVAGGGVINSTMSAAGLAGYPSRDYKGISSYTTYVGLIFKYYLNPTLDITVGTNFYTGQSFYLDAVPLDKKLDNYLLTNVGVSYKFGARKGKQHIEWTNVIIKDRLYVNDYITDFEKHVGEPIDAAGNFFIFNKDTIAKLQMQSVQLQKKTAQLEAKSAELESKNSGQQKEIDSMQNQLKTIRVMLDTLQNKQYDNIETPADVAPPASATPQEKAEFAKLQAKKADIQSRTAKLEAKTTLQQRKIDSLLNVSNNMHLVLRDMQDQVNKLKQGGKGISEVKAITEIPNAAAQTKIVVPTTPETLTNSEKVAAKNERVKSAKGEKQQGGEVEANRGRSKQSIVKGKALLKNNQKGNEAVMEEGGATSVNASTSVLNNMNEISEPAATYNVIGGAYLNKKYAYIFRNKLRAKGYGAAIFRSSTNSRMLRVCFFSTEDKKEAIKMMRKGRTEIDPQVWIHVFHSK